MANFFSKKLKDFREVILRAGAIGALVSARKSLKPYYDGQNTEIDGYLQQLSGFTGSDGLGIVLNTTAIVFVDGRYTVQAKQQLNPREYSVAGFTITQVVDWLGINCKLGGKLLYDPWCHTAQQIEFYHQYFEPLNIKLIAVTDLFCQLDSALLFNSTPSNSPAITNNKKFIKHDDCWSGESTIHKLKGLIKVITDKGIDYCLITSPTVVSWLLNIRSQWHNYSVECQAYALVSKGGVINVFTDLEKVTSEVKDFCGATVIWHRHDGFSEFINCNNLNTVLLDYGETPQAVLTTLLNSKVQVYNDNNPCLLPIATKNQVEQDGMRQAHKKDGVALVNFLCWLSGELANRPVKEEEAAEAALNYRQEQLNFLGESFPIISAAGKNAAIVHYNPIMWNGNLICAPMLYLVDSGGHYLDGTTDVTRTIAVGSPTAAQKIKFTKVLKGYIALASAIFPVGTTGHQLDVLARQFLWKDGVDYDHSTGHGVGSCLNVHEGPQQISKKINTIPLAVGMVVTNEPGYYKTNEYGIRIESVMLVVKKDLGSDRDMLGFETLTLVPIDSRLIENDLLTNDEKQWFNSYHNQVWSTISPLLGPKARDWLKKATVPI